MPSEEVAGLNMFRFEMKAQLKSFLVWAASLIGLFVLFDAAFYGMFMGSKTAVEEVLKSLPPAFAAVFGVNIDTIFSYAGFFHFIYTYLALVGAIMAASVALSAFSREKRAKCTDFLLTKPVERRRVFAMKLLACLTVIIVTNILFLAAAIVSYTGNTGGSPGLDRLILASLSLLFVQLVFLALGILYAVLARKVRSVSGTATALGFAGFILMALHSLIGEDFLRYFSPLNYFNPDSVFQTGGFEGNYVIAAVAVVVASAGFAFVRYCRDDVHAV